MSIPQQKQLLDGIIGFVATSSGVAVSMANIEAYLRITSLLVGIAVGAVTLYRLLRGKH